ncbi:MAG: hypothetical protein IPN49_08230 [Saprospiraceae bacterium]|nr:hypothetical protein [Saprospiraceae bacterium]
MKIRIVGDYIFIFEYSKDGDLMDITYPLDYFSYNNYFYSSYAASLTLNCSSDINPVYSLFRKSVTKEYEGDKEVYMNCFKKYLLENNIPELNSEMQDNGEREIDFKFYKFAPFNQC